MPRRIDLVRTAAMVAIICLPACAGGVREQTYWVNPGVGQDQQQQRFTLDSTDCRALANQMIQEPSPPPQPQTGSITLNTPRGPVYGTYQTQPPVQQGFQPDGFLGGMLRGQRTQDRRDYVAACMGNRGWQQRQR